MLISGCGLQEQRYWEWPYFTLPNAVTSRSVSDKCVFWCLFERWTVDRCDPRSSWSAAMWWSSSSILSDMLCRAPYAPTEAADHSSWSQGLTYTFISGPLLGGCLCVTLCLSCPSVRPSVLCLPTHHFADVPFNWRQADTAVFSSQQQAWCVILYTLLGRTTIISAVYQADTLVELSVNWVLK